MSVSLKRAIPIVRVFRSPATAIARPLLLPVASTPLMGHNRAPASFTVSKRPFHQLPFAMSDQYSQKAAEEGVSLQDKVVELEAIIKDVGTSMLTTVGTDGKSLHSRAMRDASHEKLIFTYIYDNTSHKEEEIQNDQDVNISFVKPTSGDWVSIAGTVVNSSNDRDQVGKYYNPAIKAWFGDLQDGVHDGTEKDPRMSIMQIKPKEVRYFSQKKTMIGQAVDVAASAVTGKVAKPGVVRTITAQEIQSLQ